jgi:hypothetical protein
LGIFHVNECHEINGIHANEAGAPLETYIFNLNERPCVSVPIE